MSSANITVYVTVKVSLSFILRRIEPNIKGHGSWEFMHRLALVHLLLAPAHLVDLVFLAVANNQVEEIALSLGDAF